MLKLQTLCGRSTCEPERNTFTNCLLRWCIPREIHRAYFWAYLNDHEQPQQTIWYLLKMGIGICISPLTLLDSWHVFVVFLIASYLKKCGDTTEGQEISEQRNRFSDPVDPSRSFSNPTQPITTTCLQATFLCSPLQLLCALLRETNLLYKWLSECQKKWHRCKGDKRIMTRQNVCDPLQNVSRFCFNFFHPCWKMEDQQDVC